MIIYFLVVVIIFIIGYFFYGKILENLFFVKSDEEVPSKTKFDGTDFVPTNKFVLFGHHFSSIAGAGPIVGPIIAGVAFGWLPSILWIVLGTIFIGGVHDFASLIISVRHQGKSIAEVANKYINKRTYKLFLAFIWLALVYVITVFADLAADTFSKEPSVAQISIFYIFIAIIFGILVYKLKFKLSFSTILMLAIIGFGIYYNLNHNIIFLGKKEWVWVLLVYCFFASILPVWLLLQPRDYMSSFLLYVSVVIGFIGLVFGNQKIVYPEFVSYNSVNVDPMVPFIFITIACGAISGFHSLVSSGTTSKQLSSMKDARFVSYGGMIFEGIVAMIALSTVMILSKESVLISKPPAEIYSNGIATFVGLLGLSPQVGKVLGYLIISSFILTTLDSATRIARYIFQEFFNLKDNSNFVRTIATIFSLILPIILLNINLVDTKGNIVPCWKVVWPLFGTTNQLLAALVLLVIYVWVTKISNSKNKLLVLVPSIFMLVITFLSLFYYIIKKNVLIGRFDVITVIGIILFLLASILLFESIRILSRKDG